MTRPSVKLGLLGWILVTCVVALALGGCETAKGLGRDIQKADEWIQDHLW